MIEALGSYMPTYLHHDVIVSFVLNRSGSAGGPRLAWGVPSADPHRPMDPRLTVREGEVLRWLSRGKTDRDIGEILGISPRTVHKHLQRVYEKLGVETRTAAVARAFL